MHRRSFALFFVAAIQIRSAGQEFTGAGIDHLVRGTHAERPSVRANNRFRLAAHGRELTIGETHALHAPHRVCIDRRLRRIPRLRVKQFAQLFEKPRIDCRDLVNFRRRHAEQHRVLELEDAFRRRTTERTTQCFPRNFGEPIVNETFTNSPTRASRLECAECLLKRFLERPSDSHRFANRLHLGRESRIARRKLFEREARALHHNVVEHGLETRRCGFRDVIRDFVERVANRQLGTDARDRKTRRFRCERR